MTDCKKLFSKKDKQWSIKDVQWTKKDTRWKESKICPYLLTQSGDYLTRSSEDKIILNG